MLMAKKIYFGSLGLNVGDIVQSGENADIKPGNALKLENIPVGTLVHNIELKPGKGGQIVRSAGTYAQLMAKEGRYAQIRLPSGEVRMVNILCKATIGQVGNIEHGNIRIGKAGKTRWLGFRPHVRGSAMNPVDHPHGGGEGRSPIGKPSPVTPWGKPTRIQDKKEEQKSDQYIQRKETNKCWKIITNTRRGWQMLERSVYVK